MASHIKGVDSPYAGPKGPSVGASTAYNKVLNDYTTNVQKMYHESPQEDDYSGLFKLVIVGGVIAVFVMYL